MDIFTCCVLSDPNLSGKKEPYCYLFMQQYFLSRLVSPSTITLGTGDEGLAPTNSASNIIPPGVRKQFAQAREASVHAFQNVSR